MRLATVCLAAVVAALPLAPALAQTEQQKELPQTERTFNLSLEQRHTIKEVIKDAHVAKAADNIDVTAGTAPPAGVALHDMPDVIAQKVPQIKSHKFFVVGDKVVIVEPKDNKIALVID